MFNFIARLLLTGTALAPVGLTYAWVAWTQDKECIAQWFLGGSLLLVAICLVMLWTAKRALPASDFQATGVEAADHENTAFLLLYVMPLFTDRVDALNWQLWIPTLAIFAVITATGYNYHFNPLLSIFQWHFYKVDSPEGVKYVLITRKQLRSVSSKIKVGQLTAYLLLDLEEK